jgi:hypothetical protein
VQNLARGARGRFRHDAHDAPSRTEPALRALLGLLDTIEPVVLAARLSARPFRRDAPSPAVRRRHLDRWGTPYTRLDVPEADS